MYFGLQILLHVIVTNKWGIMVGVDFFFGKELRKSVGNQMELGICFYHRQQISLAKVVHNGVTYYPCPRPKNPLYTS